MAQQGWTDGQDQEERLSMNDLEERLDFGTYEGLRNALRWVHFIAGMHFMGQAFEPDHMRALANLAADALAGKDLPEFGKVTEEARKEADRLIKALLIDE
jgi:hypothetical protein